MSIKHSFNIKPGKEQRVILIEACEEKKDFCVERYMFNRGQ